MSFYRKQRQPARRAALILNLSVSTLTDWDKIFDKNMRPFIRPEKRGKACKITSKLVGQVVKKAEELKSKGKRIRLKSFTMQLATEGIILSSKTVSEILIANGLRDPSTRKRRPRFYQSLRRRIPNGLLGFDGGEFTVYLNDYPVTLNLELGVDIGTFMHTAFSIGDTETRAEVLHVVQTHIEEWGKPIGIVCDHGSANMSREVVEYINSLEIEFTPSGPANPKGNGSLEGAFSQMKQVIGAIHIDTSSPEKLAKSVLDAIVSVYVTMRNKISLRDKNASPLENFIKPVGEDQIGFERQRLRKHKEDKNRKTDDQSKIDRIHFLILNRKIHCEPDALKRAEKTIVRYDTKAIIATEKAFINAVNIKPERLNLPYFFGILKNIQQEQDDERYRDYCRQRFNHQQMLDIERQMQPSDKLPTIKNIVNMLEKGISLPTHRLREVCLRLSKKWILKLIDAQRYIGTVKKKIIDAIGENHHLSIEHKEQIMDYVQQIINLKSEAERVT